MIFFPNFRMQKEMTKVQMSLIHLCMTGILIKMMMTYGKNGKGHKDNQFKMR